MLKRNPWLKHWRMLLKIWKKYVLVTAHLNFNFWYCNPISKAKQGHKLKFSCPKWAFCHKSSLLFSFLSCPTQLLERGESQHVKYFLGTGNFFFLWVNEGNYKNWGDENDSNCLNFFPDFLLLQNFEFWAFEGPFQAKNQKDVKDDGTGYASIDFMAFILPICIKLQIGFIIINLITTKKALQNTLFCFTRELLLMQCL